MSLLGAALSGQKKHGEAEPILLQGFAGMKQREAVMSFAERSRLTEVGEWIVRLYEETEQPEKARAWRATLQPHAGPK
jgi:hypothetical protein